MFSSVTEGAKPQIATSFYKKKNQEPSPCLAKQLLFPSGLTSPAPPAALTLCRILSFQLQPFSLHLLHICSQPYPHWASEPAQQSQPSRASPAVPAQQSQPSRASPAVPRLLCLQPGRDVGLEVISHGRTPGPGTVYLICRPGTSTQGEKKKITGNLSEH